MTFGDAAEYSKHKDCFIKLHGTKIQDYLADEEAEMDRELKILEHNEIKGVTSVSKESFSENDL